MRNWSISQRLIWATEPTENDVLWVAPGSHRRPNSAVENDELLSNRRVPLLGSIPVELKAGDGVVYTNTILYWGSNYSPRLRRTVHLGYRSYGGPQFPYVPQMRREGNYEHYLDEECQALCRRHRTFYDAECARIRAR